MPQLTMMNDIDDPILDNKKEDPLAWLFLLKEAFKNWLILMMIDDGFFDDNNADEYDGCSDDSDDNSEDLVLPCHGWF